MTITSEAMIVSCTMMRMLVGMWLRIRLTERFENAVTAITASAHHERRLHLGRDRERRADAEHLQRDRVVVEERIEERLAFLVGHRHSDSSLGAELARGRGRSRSRPSQNVQRAGHAAAGDRGAGEPVDLVGILRGRARPGPSSPAMAGFATARRRPCGPATAPSSADCRPRRRGPGSPRARRR